MFILTYLFLIGAALLRVAPTRPGRAHDPAAVAGAVPVVQAVCRRQLAGLTRPLLDPQDVAQDVLVSLLSRSGVALDGTHRGYFAAAATNRCTDALRRAGREYRHRAPVALDDVPVQVDPHPGPERSAVDAELRERLTRLLAEVLTDLERAVIFLRVWCNLSAEQTAAVLGSSAGAVRGAHHRGVRRLRARLVGGAR